MFLTNKGQFIIYFFNYHLCLIKELVIKIMFLNFESIKYLNLNIVIFKEK